MDTLHALILLTWWLKFTGSPSSRSYSASMMRMGMDLGLTDQDSLMMLHEKERARRRSAWEVAYRLNGAGVTPYDRDPLRAKLSKEGQGRWVFEATDGYHGGTARPRHK
ncbi:hypothetical protein C0991_000777 [Blastosporella zonata]|nr:hypothetical protein C0991_000777 [Blastosporella zonata]